MLLVFSVGNLFSNLLELVHVVGSLVLGTAPAVARDTWPYGLDWSAYQKMVASSRFTNHSWFLRQLTKPNFLLPEILPRAEGCWAL